MKRLALNSLSIFMLLVYSLFLGCEVNTGSSSGSGSLRITPAFDDISTGEQKIFAAVGGFNNSWSLENSSLGIITLIDNNTAIYTATASPAVGEVTQVIRVTSSLFDGEQTIQSSAEAFVTHNKGIATSSSAVSTASKTTASGSSTTSETATTSGQDTTTTITSTYGGFRRTFTTWKLVP